MTDIFGLNIQQADFTDVKVVKTLALRILSLANEQSAFLSKQSLTSDAAAIRIAAKEWVVRVESIIDNLSHADALIAIGVFDLIHRIGYGIPADSRYIDRYKLGAFKAYIHGDESVNQYVLFQIISDEISRHSKAYFGRPLDWYCTCIDRWFRNFRTGKSSVLQSDYDTFNQVKILLSSDLRAFTPKQEAFKRALEDRYSELINSDVSTCFSMG